MNRLRRRITRLGCRAAALMRAAVIAVWLVAAGPAWIYGLRDGKSGGAVGSQPDGPLADVLAMAKAGWDEAKLPIVVFLMLGIALAAQRHRHGHDDAKDEIKGKVIAIVLALFAFPIAY